MILFDLFVQLPPKQAILVTSQIPVDSSGLNDGIGAVSSIFIWIIFERRQCLCRSSEINLLSFASIPAVTAIAIELIALMFYVRIFYAQFSSSYGIGD